MTIVALLGIFISLGFLIVMAYRGHSVVLIAPIAATIAAVLSGAPLLGNLYPNFYASTGKVSC